MIEGKEDRQYSKIEKKGDRFLASMAKMSEKEKPAFKEPVKPLDRLFNFDSMTEKDIQNFIFEYGIDEWGVEAMKADRIRRRYNAKR